MMRNTLERLYRFTILLALVLGTVACTEPQVAPPESVGLSSEKLQDIHGLLEGLVETKSIAGGVALVARKGQIAYLDAVGMQDVETETPMAPDTIFRICSMTKPITSVAIMMLVDEGLLSLDDPVAKFIPEFEGVKVLVSGSTEGTPADREITIQHLLTHTSGLTYGFMGTPVSALYREGRVSDGLIETDGTIGDNAARIASMPLLFQPGSAWAYSLATDVLGRVVEVASAKTLDAFFRERIFEPLGMKDTYFRLPPEKRSRLAAVYQPAADDTIERLPEGRIETDGAVYSAGYPYSGSGKYFSGGAGLVSTVPDYARFLQMLLAGGEFDGVRLLKETTVELMTKDHCSDVEGLIEDHGDGFGLGFGVVTEAAKDRGLGSVGTYSWGGFYFTYFWVDPAEKLVGIVMAQLYPWGERTLWNDFRGLTYKAITD